MQTALATDEGTATGRDYRQIAPPGSRMLVAPSTALRDGCCATSSGTGLLCRGLRGASSRRTGPVRAGRSGPRRCGCRTACPGSRRRGPGGSSTIEKLGLMSMRPKSARLQTALVGERTDDLARLDPMPLARRRCATDEAAGGARGARGARGRRLRHRPRAAAGHRPGRVRRSRRRCPPPARRAPARRTAPARGRSSSWLSPSACVIASVNFATRMALTSSIVGRRHLRRASCGSPSRSPAAGAARAASRTRWRLPLRPARPVRPIRCT